MGIDRAGVHRLLIPSESRPGKEHTLLVDAGGVVVSCSCEGYAAAAGDPTRRPCWHALAAADLLAYHLDPPPADPGGAALDRAQADIDEESRDWILGGKLSPAPWLVAPGESRRRHDDGMATLYGPDWRES